MSFSQWVHLEDCTVKKVTERAMLIEYDGNDVWLPLSQVSEAEQYEEGDEGITISVTEFIAREKGIEV